MVGTNGGEVGHPDGLVSIFIDDRKPAQNGFIAGVAQAHLLQEAAVDLVDELEMAGQQASEHVQIPFLQGFRQQGVVGVRD